MRTQMKVTLQVNGGTHVLVLEPRRTLLDALRHDFALTKAKKVCDMGNCGVCTVLLDGEAIYACLRLAVDCEGHPITTMEGLAHHGELDPMQQAFIDADAFQCGFCASGQIMSLKGLLQETKNSATCMCAAARLREGGAMCNERNGERRDERVVVWHSAKDALLRINDNPHA